MALGFILLLVLRLYNYITSCFRDRTPKYTHKRTVVSDSGYDDDDLFDMTRVPEDTIVVDEYELDGHKKCRIYYEGFPLGHAQLDYEYDPFKVEAYKPWIWFGDKTTEVDLTNAMEKYLVPGNIIDIELLLKLIHIREDTNIIYVDARTFQEVKFPAEGIRIRAVDASDDDE